MRKIIIILLLLLVCTMLIIALLLFRSTKESQNIIFIGERSFVNTPKTIATISLDHNYALLKVYNNDIFVTTWEGDNKGAIFKLNLNTNNFETHIDLKKIANTAISIADYHFIENDGEALIYFINLLDPKSIVIASQNKIIEKYQSNHAIQRVSFRKETIFTTTWDSLISTQYFKTNLNDRTTERIPFNHYNTVNYSGILLDGILNTNENYTTITSYAQNVVLLFDRNFAFLRSMNLNIENLKLMKFLVEIP